MKLDISKELQTFNNTCECISKYFKDDTLFQKIVSEYSSYFQTICNSLQDNFNPKERNVLEKKIKEIHSKLITKLNGFSVLLIHNNFEMNDIIEIIQIAKIQIEELFCYDLF